MKMCIELHRAHLRMSISFERNGERGHGGEEFQSSPSGLVLLEALWVGSKVRAR